MREAQLRFPNASNNADEQRQLKAELHKLLLRLRVDGERMLSVADAVPQVVQS